MDNASVLTLASSAYAIPGLRGGNNMPGYNSTAPSAIGATDSLSHFGGSVVYPDAESTSQYVLGDDERLEERDVDASVRALRPRSSRRGSWESEASRWSARIQQGTGTPSLVRERSLWTTNSVRTGGFSTENVETYDRPEDTGDGNADTSEEPAQLDSAPSLAPGVIDRESSGSTSPSTSHEPNSTHVTDESVQTSLIPPHSEHHNSSDTVAQLATASRHSEDGKVVVKPVNQTDEGGLNPLHRTDESRENRHHSDGLDVRNLNPIVTVEKPVSLPVTFTPSAARV